MLSLGTAPMEAWAPLSAVGTTGEVVCLEFCLMYLLSFTNAANCWSLYGPSDLLAISLAVSLPDSVSRLLHLSWSSMQKLRASVRRLRASSHAACI